MFYPHTSILKTHSSLICCLFFQEITNMGTASLVFTKTCIEEFVYFLFFIACVIT